MAKIITGTIQWAETKMTGLFSGFMGKAKLTIMSLAVLLFCFSHTVAAISQEQIGLFERHIYYFDNDTCQAASAAIDSDVPVVGGQQVYQSGLAGPYILEQWAIHVLKAIAAKQNIPETDTVTQEHVIALLAFAKGEGGDIANQDLFNPLNTGIDAAELIDGAHAGNGVQSFKSFDAGVEAAARTMTGNYQNRTAKTLSDPNSSATDFMKALSYYQRYRGNLFWAEASKPPHQDSYYQGRLDLVKYVKSNYKSFASLIIGTSDLEERSNKTDPSKLTYGDGGTPAAADNAGASNCICSTTGSDTPVVLNGNDNQEQAFNFFVSQGATAVEAAGIVGNLMVESTDALDPNASNGTHEGIGQWDSGRWAKLLEFASKQPGDKSPRSFLVQLKFTWQESPTKAYIQTHPDTPEIAAQNFESLFERSGGSLLDKRKQNARAIYDKYGSAQADVNTTTATSTNPDCDDSSAQDGKAFVSGGYAWPIDLTKSEVNAGYPLPCKQASCHHDGTAAFDLSHKDTVKSNKDSKVVGKAVFAIADGEIAKAGIYQGIAGCYAIEFKAADGYVYWYGHLRRPVSTTVGKKFSAGEKIAEVGERKCTGNGSYPHLHIDRGSPKGNFGGMAGSRDPGINDVINNLYESLPD